MAIKLVLSSNEIVSKVFSRAPAGYNANEVDEFLDLVLADYRLLEKELQNVDINLRRLETKISELETDNQKKDIEISRLETRNKNIKEEGNISGDNIDLIKRINVLEEFLWQHNFDPSKIK